MCYSYYDIRLANSLAYLSVFFFYCILFRCFLSMERLKTSIKTSFFLSFYTIVLLVSRLGELEFQAPKGTLENQEKDEGSLRKEEGGTVSSRENISVWMRKNGGLEIGNKISLGRPSSQNSRVGAKAV